MYATNSSFNEVVVTYGEDAENTMKSSYVKLWTLDDGNTNYEELSTLNIYWLEPRKTILIGKLGEPERIISSLHLMNDCSILTLGTKRGTLQVYETSISTKNILDSEAKYSVKIFDKKEIKLVQNIKKMNEVDIYFTNE